MADGGLLSIGGEALQSRRRAGTRQEDIDICFNVLLGRRWELDGKINTIHYHHWTLQWAGQKERGRVCCKTHPLTGLSSSSRYQSCSPLALLAFTACWTCGNRTVVMAWYG